MTDLKEIAEKLIRDATIVHSRDLFFFPLKLRCHFDFPLASKKMETDFFSKIFESPFMDVKEDYDFFIFSDWETYRPIVENVLWEKPNQLDDDIFCSAGPDRYRLFSTPNRASYFLYHPEWPKSVAYTNFLKDDSAHGYLRRGLLNLLLSEHMRKFDYYKVHSGAVAHKGRAALITGDSGAGKSTTCILLMISGLQIIDDDIIFYDASETGPRVLSASGEISLCLDGRLKSKDLDDLVPKDVIEGKETAGKKAILNLQKHSQNRFTIEAEPRLLLHVHKRAKRGFDFFPLSPEESLMRFLRQSLFFTYRERSDRHMDALVGLTKSCENFRLEVGPDLVDHLGDLKDKLQQMLAG